jgi:hypothetical protein
MTDSDTPTLVESNLASTEPDDVKVTRRRFYRVSLLGAGVIGALARTWTDAVEAIAGPLCCDLAHPNGPWCGGTEGDPYFTCPPTHPHKWAWYCCWPSGLISCWECTTSTVSCWYGSFANCSNWSGPNPGC